MSAREDDDHAFGVRLLAARIAREWTPAELAVKAGVSVKVVGQVEDGRGCTAVEADRLAEALDVPLELLLGPAKVRDVV